jgi:hypothetical protein
MIEISVRHCPGITMSSIGVSVEGIAEWSGSEITIGKLSICECSTGEETFSVEVEDSIDQDKEVEVVVTLRAARIPTKNVQLALLRQEECIIMTQDP